MLQFIPKVCKVPGVATFGLKPAPRVPGVQPGPAPEQYRARLRRGAAPHQSAESTTTEYVTPMWDTEVDVAVIGAGMGGVANAIATVDAGGEVLVADAIPARRGEPSAVRLRERLDAKRGWLVHETVDLETAGYFASVCEGIPELAHLRDARFDDAVPHRIARNLSQDEAFGQPVETFVGARLPGWAAQCIASPYGLLYTSMRDWRSTTMKSGNGDTIEAHSIGTIEWADGFGDGTLRQWLTTQAQERDIEVEAGSTLDRIVFEEGAIAGVVLSTPEGPLAVRTRAGITFAPRDEDVDLHDAATAAGDRLQVCIVGRTASRFGRLELMATEPTGPTRPTCTGSRRQVREGMHDARQASLEGWRCGKVHGHTAFGQ